MNRTEILNILAERYGYQRFLEIGVKSGINMRTVLCDYKVGVDPDRHARGATHRMFSDEFFASNDEKFDLVFIDGDHSEEQVTKDVNNALSVLMDGGAIVMHDCNPPDEWSQRPASEFKGKRGERWNGTAWRSYMDLSAENSELNMCVVDCDEGVGVIRKGLQERVVLPEPLTYGDLTANRVNYLNLVQPSDFISWLGAIDEK